MSNKYIIVDTADGSLKEQQAVTSATPDSIPSLDTNGRLSPDMMPVGVAADTLTIEASEALSAGDFVNIWNTDPGGTDITNVRKADPSSPGKEADGFVLAAVVSGDDALVYFEGGNDSVTGLIPGTAQFLDSANPGKTTHVVPTSGVLQRVGRAVSATKIAFEPNQPIDLL